MVVFMSGTTLEKLKINKCYCLKKKEDINLTDCNGFECSRWKKCMQKSNNDVKNK